jgi:excisionase family DNA binding protein
MANDAIDLYPDMPDTLTPAQLTTWLPQSRRTVDRWIAEGSLPAFRLGGRLLIRKADVLAMARPVRAAG